MPSSPHDFERQLAHGREVEKAVAKWLMRRGNRVLPVYDYSGLDSGKPPKLQAFSSADSLVCPDLFAIKNGTSVWCEVKWKQHADFTRSTQSYETGIAMRLWNHYLRVEQQSGCPVWLIFCHQDENEIRAQALSILRHHHRIYSGPKMSHGGMVFFDYNGLRLLARLSDVINPPFAKQNDRTDATGGRPVLRSLQSGLAGVQGKRPSAEHAVSVRTRDGA